jgi:hypothetical protein
MWKFAFSGPFRNVVYWHIRTQVGARRNALVALTELTERRREFAEVSEFLEGLPRSQAEPVTKTDDINSANL